MTISTLPGAKCWCGGPVSSFTGELRCNDSSFHDPAATGKRDVVTKIYIAGPMSGYPECNYPAFNEAEIELLEHGYEVVNPASVHVERCHYTDLIREDLRVMLDCHAVATLEGWWESVGARNEVQVAGILKMPVRSIGEWLALAEAAKEQHVA